MKNIILILSSCFFYTLAMASDTTSLPEQDVTTESEIVTVDELRSSMRENAVIAEEYFTNGLLLRGKFNSLGFDGKHYELKLDYINDGIFTPTTTCKFSKEHREKLKPLKKGDILVIKGILKKYYDENVVMEDCSIFTPTTSCKFSKEHKEELQNLKKGDVLIVKGILKKYDDGNIVMENCALVDAEREALE